MILQLFFYPGTTQGIEYVFLWSVQANRAVMDPARPWTLNLYP